MFLSIFLDFAMFGRRPYCTYTPRSVIMKTGTMISVAAAFRRLRIFSERLRLGGKRNVRNWASVLSNTTSRNCVVILASPSRNWINRATRTGMAKGRTSNAVMMTSVLGLRNRQYSKPGNPLMPSIPYQKVAN